MLGGTVVAIVLVLTAVAAPAPAVAQQPSAPPLPRAWVAVDADTGAVIDAGNDRRAMRVASLSKILTALVVAENLPAGAEVPVSARAAGMPARRINLKEGEVWRRDDLLHALLLVSANDAAVALAEATAGSLEGFAGMLDQTARRLGLADGPVLRDPAGLDDEFSHGGGNLVSARDLAIVARAFLARPEIASIVALPEYRFEGGDGLPHRLRNHVTLLRTYPGAVGLKTGYTKRAGHSVVAAARRSGRTAVAVVIGAAYPSASAAALLDRTFATPVEAQAELHHLPPVVLGDARDPATGGAPAPRGVSVPEPVEARTSEHAALALLVVGGTPAALILVRRRRRSRRPDPSLRPARARPAAPVRVSLR